MQKRGAIVSGVLGVTAMAALMLIFVRNASPYVTVKQAKADGGSGLHIAGQIAKGTLTNDISHGEIRFTIVDADGQTLPVVYKGQPVSNLGDSTKVVAVGNFKDGKLESDQLLVKCPSKYEASKASL